MTGIGRIILDDGTIIDLTIRNAVLETTFNERTDNQVGLKCENSVIRIFQRRSDMPEPIPYHQASDA